QRIGKVAVRLREQFDREYADLRVLRNSSQLESGLYFRARPCDFPFDEQWGIRAAVLAYGAQTTYVDLDVSVRTRIGLHHACVENDPEFRVGRIREYAA